MSDWYAAAARFLGGFPGRVLAADTETTGLDVDSPSTLITQLGWAVADGDAILESGAVVLDWSAPGPWSVPRAQYRAMLERVAAEMAARGQAYRVTWEMVEREGAPPAEALRHYRDLLASAQAVGWAVCGHNFYRYDAPLLAHWFRRLGFPLELDPERLVDTGLLEKVRRMGESPPLPGECRRADWYAEAAEARSRVRWNLANACDAEYGLLASLGEAGAGRAHDAGFDCLLTCRLVAAMRGRAEAAGAAAA